MIEEKLQHFRDSAMTNSRNESARILEEYTAALEKLFAEHKEEVTRKAELEILHEKELIRREGNKEMAREQLEIKRRIGILNAQLTEKIFDEVKELAEEFKKTPEYEQMMIRQIQEAKAFARGEHMIIYIDPVDREKVRRISEAASCILTISEYSFGGGIRVVFPRRNILIDNSFDTKLAQKKADFNFMNGGIAHV